MKLLEFLNKITEGLVNEKRFWYDPTENELHTLEYEDADHADWVAKKLGLGNNYDLTGPVIAGLKAGYVRMGWRNSENPQLTLYLEGNNLKDIHKAARAFIKEYGRNSVTEILMDVNVVKAEPLEWYSPLSTQLRGNRMNFFLKHGSIPSRMVQETLQNN